MENRILIVEGDDNYRSYLVDFFSAREFRSVGCGSYKEALKCVEQSRFDIVIADYFIGSESGRDFCDRFGKLQGWETSLIITSDAQSTEIERCVRSHAPDFYFVKPFVIDNLYAVVLRIVQARDKKSLLRRKALAV
jgi:DNA-binding response OmpR family regulator